MDTIQRPWGFLLVNIECITRIFTAQIENVSAADDFNRQWRVLKKQPWVQSMKQESLVRKNILLPTDQTHSRVHFYFQPQCDSRRFHRDTKMFCRLNWRSDHILWQINAEHQVISKGSHMVVLASAHRVHRTKAVRAVCWTQDQSRLFPALVLII